MFKHFSENDVDLGPKLSTLSEPIYHILEGPDSCPETNPSSAGGFLKDPHLTTNDAQCCTVNSYSAPGNVIKQVGLPHECQASGSSGRPHNEDELYEVPRDRFSERVNMLTHTRPLHENRLLHQDAQVLPSQGHIIKRTTPTDRSLHSEPLDQIAERGVTIEPLLDEEPLYHVLEGPDSTPTEMRKQGAVYQALKTSPLDTQTVGSPNDYQSLKHEKKSHYQALKKH